MPPAPTVIPVAGTVAHDHAGQPVLVLTHRIDGQDTFLIGTLELISERKIEVRILTLDDVSVLRASDTAGLPPIGATWEGFLHLPHGLRAQRIPDDLATAATARGRSLDALDAAELRYALTFLGEATTAAIRTARIEAITHALPSAVPPTRLDI